MSIINIPYGMFPKFYLRRRMTCNLVTIIPPCHYPSASRSALFKKMIGINIIHNNFGFSILKSVLKHYSWFRKRRSNHIGMISELNSVVGVVSQSSKNNYISLIIRRKKKKNKKGKIFFFKFCLIAYQMLK